MAPPYRDALGAVRERVQLLEAEVRHKSRRVNAVRLALVPEALAARVDELLPRLDEEPEPTLTAWLEREAELSALGSALDEAETRAPALVTGDGPPPVPDPGDRLYLVEEPRDQQLKHQVESELEEHARHITRTRWGDHAYVWKLSLGDVELALRGRAWLDVIKLLYVELAISVKVPPEVGPLSVTTASWWYGDTTRAILGELDLEDSEFARHFRVDGQRRLGRALLTDEVRRELLSLRRHHPRLELGDGIASLVWRLDDVAYDEPSFGVLAGARALVGLRERLGG